MSRSLKKILSRWTKPGNKKDARKNIFFNIRDIEYMILPGQFSRDENVEQVISDRKGFCLSKHYLLGTLLSEIGYSVRYCTYAFHWFKSGIQLPPEISLLAKNLPVTYHAACKFHLNGIWVLTDATWDRFLLKAGFPVNSWNGTDNTALAVKAIEEFESKDILSHKMFYQKKMREYTSKEKLIMARFTGKFNEWISCVRQMTR